MAMMTISPRAAARSPQPESCVYGPLIGPFSRLWRRVVESLLLGESEGWVLVG